MYSKAASLECCVKQVETLSTVFNCCFLSVKGTFLVGQPSHQSSAKQGTSGTTVQGSASAGTSSAQGQQALKVITGHKTAALFAQVTAEPY